LNPQQTAGQQQIAVIGGGINGLCSAWELARRGARVILFERGELMRETSSNSSKMLHGGVRYLENMEIRLVYEALHERAWWLRECPQLAHEMHLLLPVYKGGPRPKWMLKIGLALYDLLAGKQNLTPHQWLTREQLLARDPGLNATGLQGGFSYADGQMDDYALGMWAAGEARKAGVDIVEHAKVLSVTTDGQLTLDGETRQFDKIANIAGPWAEQLLQQSGIASKIHLDLVRGSHILFADPPAQPYLLQSAKDGRVFFVLPYKGQTLVGTTEKRQQLDEAISIDDTEIDYLLTQYNRYFNRQRTRADIVATSAGLRPLLKSARNPRKASREYVIDQQDRLLTVYGGKWTTARALGKKVADKLL
jgi:glycerol-3-phosphate dehydrogenase